MFFAALPAAVLWATRGSLWPPAGATLWLGLGLALAAQAAVVWHVAAFIREGHGTHAPFDPPRTLVLSGLYRRTRNPMYLLYFAVILGEALAWRSPALAVYAAGFLGLAHLYVTRVEEPALARRFGADYERYRARVPRWLGRRPG